ncbi:MAG: TolC family protein [Williamsia sp.]|nr:TolC family protein [Williamsia sp.]
MKNWFLRLAIFVSLVFPYGSYSQSKQDSVLRNASLADCIQFALKNQPLIRQAQIDEDIAENTIKSNLAGWFPQLSGGFLFQHYLKLPTSFFPDATTGAKRPVQTGVKYTSNVQFQLSQSIFNRDLLLASTTARDVRRQARQTTTADKIDITVNVSKAYYDLLLTQRQVEVLDENIVRAERSLQDAYNQYKGGLVDKTDYKRAQIELNNTRADRKRAFDLINAKAAVLKQVMGYPTDQPVSVRYDSLQLERDALIDTGRNVVFSNRIEYQLLETQQSLLQANFKYARYAYLPTVSANGNYIPTYQNDQLTNLYRSVYPTSLVGLSITIPIFQGGKRIYDIRNAALQVKRANWDMIALKQQINAEYFQALSSYKGNLAELNALKENVDLAREVYSTLRVQYNAGIKTYLDVVIAETDLRAAELNYFNALFAVLSSKLDVEQAAGTVVWER